MAIETYPTKLILRTFLQVQNANGFLTEAYKYVKHEQVYNTKSATFSFHSLIIPIASSQFNTPLSLFYLTICFHFKRNNFHIYTDDPPRPLAQMLWPEIKPEIILLDFLFNPNNKYKVTENDAILLTVLLTDLQEDYRYHVKRAMLRFVLR